MEDGEYDTSAAGLSMNHNTTTTNTLNTTTTTPTTTTAAAAKKDESVPGRTLSGSITSASTGISTSTAGAGHRRSVSGSLLSKLSFLRTTPNHNQNQNAIASSSSPSSDQARSGYSLDSNNMNNRRDDHNYNKENDDGDGDGDGDGENESPSAGASAGFRGGSKAMASALQQQRRTRRRRGSLRKTALLGTRFEGKKMKGVGNNNTSTTTTANANSNAMDGLRGDDVASGGQQRQQQQQAKAMRSVGTEQALDRGSRENNPRWGYIDSQQRKVRRGSSFIASSLARSNVLGDETGTDEEDIVSFPHLKNKENEKQDDGAGLQQKQEHEHMGAPSSPDSYFALPTDPSTYRTKSPLSATTTDIKLTTTTTTPTTPTTTAAAAAANHHKEIIWDYTETESWGWIILIVTWLVFVVGMGSCFGVWSWAWDVGETPYAPPELEDDPTLPIVGYYPALIILAAVMSWVWVVVAWVGMKYFKHANISGEEI